MMRARCTSKRIPVVAWVQDVYSLGVSETGAGGGRTAALMKMIESWTLRGADRVVVIHDRFRAYAVEALGLPAAAVEVVRNWTHLPAAMPIDPRATRHLLGWRDDELIVLHAGNQGAKQGLGNVVESARIADERNAKVRFVLLGDGNQRRKLGELASGVERIQFIAPLPEDKYQQAMAAADVLLVNERPGINEMAVPSKLTSYFSTGVPVIAATDAGSVTASEIESARAGVRVDAGDPRALVDAVIALGGDRDSARALGANGLQYRRDVLSQQAALERFEEAIRSVLTRRK